MSSAPENIFFKFSLRSDLKVILQKDSTVSYLELFNLSYKISCNLKNKGITKGDYIPLYFDSTDNFIQTVIALWNIGAVPIPLNTKLLPNELLYILEDYDFNFIISDSNTFSPILNNKIKCFLFDELLDESNGIKFTNSFNFNDEAVVIFTSGSTGKVKGVVHTFSSLANNIINAKSVLQQKENDRWLFSLPFYHIGGFQIFCRSLLNGCSIIIPESLQTQHLKEAITNYHPTHISLVSTQLDRLINQQTNPNPDLRLSLIGGGFFEDDLMFKAQNLGWNPIRVYGSSETASMISAISADELKYKPSSSGKLLDNVTIRTSEDSEILIKTNSLFKYYLNEEKETSLKVINQYFYSGDLGFFDDDGYLYVEARRNDLIVTGGENVNPIEVEKALMQIPFIKDACVFAKPDKTWGQVIVAAIVVSDFLKDEDSIKNILKQKLTGYKIPKKYYFTDSLPRTALGKLEREKIRKTF